MEDGLTQVAIQHALGILGNPLARKMFLIFCAGALLAHVGMSALAWLRKETDCFVDRLRKDPRATIYAVGSNVVAIVCMALYDGEDFAAFTWLAALVNGVYQGVAIDAVLNKNGGRIKWNDAQRAEALKAAAPASTPSPVAKTLAIAGLCSALMLGALMPRDAQAQQTLSGVALASATRTANSVVSTDRVNSQWRGVKVVFNVSARTAGTYTLKIQGKDAISGNYFDMLTGAAVNSVSTNVYTLYPGITTAANVSTSDVLPATWRVTLTGSSADMTNSVSFTLIP